MIENNIYLYGAGTRCYALYKLIKDKYKEIKIVDGDYKKWGMKFKDNNIINSPDILKNVDVPIVITNLNSRNYDDIIKDLHTKYNIKDCQIVSYEKLCWDNLRGTTSMNKNDTINFNKDSSIILDAYCCQSLGGIEEWLIDLASGLINRNYNIRILTDKEKTIINNFNYNYSDIVNRVGEYDAPESIENYCAVKKYLEEKLPCTIVTNRCNVVTMAACDIKEKYGDMIKIISVMHNGNKSYYDRQCVFGEYIDKYVCVAHDMINEMENRGIDSKKLCSTTLPFECVANLKREYTLKSSYPIQIGYAGRLDRIKNGQKRMDLLLEVIYRLVDEKINFHMTFAGDGPARGKMEETVKNKKLQSYVTFLGKIKREDIPKFWQKMDIGVSMSDYEGRSISMLEMMANGTVPIFTDVSGVSEDIVNNVNGYIIPLEDVNAAVNRIKYLYENRNNLVVMGKKAHDSMVQKSNKENHYNFWMKIFEELDQPKNEAL